MVGDEMTLAQAQVRGFELVQTHTARFIEYVNGLPQAELDQDEDERHEERFRVAPALEQRVD